MAQAGSIKAVIFDLDGTLLDTLPDIGAGSNTALRHFGLKESTMADYRRAVGNGIRVLIRKAMTDDVSEEVYEQVLAFYLKYYPEHCCVYTKFYPGIEQMLEKLKNAGYLLGILSNKTEKTAQKIIEHFFPENPFAFLWGNNGQRPLKPDITAGGLILEMLKLRPDEILYVGDGDTDMEFGSKMGFYTVGVTWGYRDADVLQACGADVLVNTPEELLSLVGL